MVLVSLCHCSSEGTKRRLIDNVLALAELAQSEADKVSVLGQLESLSDNQFARVVSLIENQIVSARFRARAFAHLARLSPSPLQSKLVNEVFSFRSEVGWDELRPLGYTLQHLNEPLLSEVLTLLFNAAETDGDRAREALLSMIIELLKPQIDNHPVLIEAISDRFLSRVLNLVRKLSDDNYRNFDPLELWTTTLPVQLERVLMTKVPDVISLVARPQALMLLNSPPKFIEASADRVSLVATVAAVAEDTCRRWR